MTNFSATIEEAERQAAASFAGKYIPYKALKKAIEHDAEIAAMDGDKPKRHTSISIPEVDGDGYEFNDLFEQAVQMVTDTADASMESFRKNVASLLHNVNLEEDISPHAKDAYLREAERLGEDYIQTEKYVNLNYLGLHKILKKHDKNVPKHPVYQFYVTWIHKQKWLSGDYSQELVMLSELFSKLRGDRSGVKNEDAAQGFVRSTKKYWVKDEVVSRVKYTVLQHLPVFRFDESKFTGDNQLINSVYLDNCSCELYHGRLDKRPGAQAIRLRWYGPGVPETVFVERKVHHEDWTGESSTKERFRLPEEKVLPYLRGEYTWDMMKDDMARAGLTQKDVDAVEPLFNAVQRKVQSAILRPTVRTQYQRVAFQIPFDATVRISLDTNLRMYKELPDEDNPLWASDWGLVTPRPGAMTHRGARAASARVGGAGRSHVNGGATPSEYSNESGGDDSIDFFAWRRNEKELPWKRTEVTKFPHSVLEVKLSLPQGQSAPEWVTELIDGRQRLAFEVHKFSKFIQGTAVLYPQCVQAVPYWIDDESVVESMLMCAEPTQENNEEAGAKTRTRGVPDTLATQLRLHPVHQHRNCGAVDLFHTDQPAAAPRGGLLQALSAVPKLSFFDKLVGAYVPRERSRYLHAMKIEPKSFFANERTFLAWLHMAVTIGSIAAALMGFAATADRNGTEVQEVASVEVICMILLPLAVMLCFYALFIFLWRSQNIALASSASMNDRAGPVCLAGIVVIAMSAIFVISVRDTWLTLQRRHQANAAFLLSCFLPSQV